MAKERSEGAAGRDAQRNQPPPRQRAYTLRLRGRADTDQSWRDALWATHEAVNKGAKVFGDWLLTMRGGLDHSLADAQVRGAKKALDRDPTPDERRDRRILLAMSWLSVESAPKQGDAHERFIVASGEDDSQSSRDEKVVARLREILRARGLQAPLLDEWMSYCAPSLSAAIRDDAVWIDRSAAFDAARRRVGASLTREEVWDLLEPFFGSRESYLTSLRGEAESDGESPAAEDKAKDLVQYAGQWLSSRFGMGKGADFAAMSKVYSAMASWAAGGSSFRSGPAALGSLAEALAGFCPASTDAGGILRLVSGPGYKSATQIVIKAWGARTDRVAADDLAKLQRVAAEDAAKCDAKTGGKGRRPWSDAILREVEAACGFTYLQADGPARHSEFAVMLDHAARRVSIGHSWIKRAEAERDRFARDADRVKDVPDAARAWLDRFCVARSGASGALDAYRIRRRAVAGWKEVVAKWDRAASKTSEDRVAAAKEIQADPDIDKFGDMQLFESLAADDAECIWRTNGEASPQSLLDYAAATDAQAKQKRFKVPAYRHPDPLSHPVFCDFGNSRWEIRFAAHDAVSKLLDARAALARRETDLVKAVGRLEKAKSHDRRAESQAALAVAERERHDAHRRVVWLSSRHALSMGLWNGEKIDDRLELRWSCKRLAGDMALRQEGGRGTAIGVTRADRLGRAAAGASHADAVAILGVFAEEHWNGRLQAPRAQLNAIAARVATHGWDLKARKMRDRLRWLVSFSAKLQAAGPWIEFAATIPVDAPAKPFVSSKGEYAVKHATNDARAGLGKLALARLPGIRVLSIDLGHRYAAACAVWEVMTTAQVAAACLTAGALRPGESDLYLHLRTRDTKGRQRTTIYRRIGSETVTDLKTGVVTPHPGSWARLERQFLVKLPGEEAPARKGSPAEIDAVRRAEESLDRVRSTEERLPTRVDELLSTAVDTARLALRRHGDAARIAYAFKPDAERLTPGGGREAMSSDGRQATILDALLLWHGLWSGDRWIDAWARRQWDAHVKPLLALDLPEWIDNSGESRRQHRGAVEDLLKPVAAALAARDGAPLHAVWAEQWRTRDASWIGKVGHLRTLRSLLLPRGHMASTSAAWNVGGLSLTRIATLKSLYQLHKAFHMRPDPDDPRKKVPAKGEDELRDFGRRILNAMERLRDQRVKQLASRLAEAALGIGRIESERVGAGAERPRERVDQPCHAVVIENLANYRPEETRTRRENRQLMSWASSKVKKYLSEACQLHGLLLREVQAGYTSRQDSRTGAPGVRCADISVRDFLTKQWWRRQVKIAAGKVEQGKGDARERFLTDLDAKWSTATESARNTSPPLRIPVNGGELFVSADPDSPAAKGLQADLNAAANIGLKVLLDPDWPGKWWFVPCDTATNKPNPEKTKGSAAIQPGVALIARPENDSESPPPKRRKTTDPASPAKRERDIVNLWRDPSHMPVAPGGAEQAWAPTPEYFRKVAYRTIRTLRRRAGLQAESR